MTIRERTEELEERMLAPYAALSKKSLGRDAAEEPCDIRTCYRRDCDRIIHCKDVYKRQALNSDFYDASQAAARGTGRNKGAFIRENAAALCE